MSRNPRLPVVCDCGDHAFALTTRGLVVVVDPEDAEALSEPWGTKWNGNYVKVSRTVRGADGRRHSVALARSLLKPDQGVLVDHRNGNTLDNRRRNLRECGLADNARNRRGNVGRVLPKGVYPSTSGKFYALICVDGEIVRLGTYRTAEDAQSAYAAAAVKYHGEFARTA